MSKSIARPALSLMVFGAVLTLLNAVPARAQPAKVWVAWYGADRNACGAASSPCRTFQQAHDNVAAGGEIGVLAPGDYASSSVTFRKSVNLSNDGTGEASVLAGLSSGIGILAATGDVVSVRGITFD